MGPASDLVFLVVLMDDGVSLAARYEVAVDREGRDERYRQRERQAPPEQQIS